MAILKKEIDSTWKVVTFTPDAVQHRRYNILFEQLREKIITENKVEDRKLIENYKPENFELFDQLCVSLLLKDHEPVAFSTLYHRPEFGNSVRCLNRLYWDPSIRVWLHRGNTDKYRCSPKVPEFSPVMAEHQAVFAPRATEFMFISKETPIKRRWCQMIAKNFTVSTGLQWHVEDKLYPVCEPTAASCWQHVIYTRFKDSGTETLLDKGISFDEYRTRFPT